MAPASGIFLNPEYMIKSFFRVAYRNLVSNKVYSSINIIGLAAGMAVALLIGVWIQDETGFNKSIGNYDRLGKIWQFVKFGDLKSSYDVSPIPLAAELKEKYPDIKSASLSTSRDVILNANERKLSVNGNYAESVFPEMIPLKMISGDDRGLQDIHSILLSEKTAISLFGKINPINKLVKLNDTVSLKVTGVFENFPANSDFRNMNFIAPWDLFSSLESWVRDSKDQWDNNSFNIYVLIRRGADFKKLSAQIKDARMRQPNPPSYKPEFFIHPMSRWHLYSEFYDGVNTGGAITNVRLFALIGGFVLLLACINFMNLSTARSEKRAKEVGIRKTIGSRRWQLVGQFFSESVLYVLIAFSMSLLICVLTLPFFNQMAGKQINIAWSDPMFWITSIGFCLFTSLLAGSYPALYLSGFEPVQTLKNTFKTGKLAALPRRILVVLQFSVSVAMIIGTIVVFQQIQFIKDRPVGYDRSGIIEVKMQPKAHYLGHYDVFRKDLLNTGIVKEMAEASGSVTEQFGGTTDISWPGKTPDQHPLLMTNSVSHDYGKTVGWQMIRGRDFSRDYGADTSAMVLNESAARIMGFKNPVGQQVTLHGKTYQVIGVMNDMIKESPFQAVKPSFFILGYIGENVIDIKLASGIPTATALAKLEKVFTQYDPASPFSYDFVDELYAAKFSDEENIGKLAGFFSSLAILISCLGLFGLASFVAEKRTREIGVRKILGASVLDLWGLVSKEFVILVGLSLFIAIPFTYYVMHHWLQSFEYRTHISAWIFTSVAMGAIGITLLTVSFQAIKAAIANPVKSLRTE